MAETILKRHPFRAAAWGFLLGLAVVLYLTVVWPVIAFDNWTTVAVKAVIVILAAMALSVLWGLFGPAKKLRGASAPPPVDDGPPPPPVDDEPLPPPNESE